jgi:hypothetical protein
MSFIKSFLDYNVGTECPTNFLRASAIATLAIAASKRYFYVKGPTKVYPTMAIVLVGRQGIRKSYPKDQARELIKDALPTYPMAAAMQSREDICKLMAADGGKRTFVNFEGVSTIHTPLAFFINELKNFLSYNPAGMIEFITDIWDREVFDASTIKRGYEFIQLPVLNFLACETPDWIMDKLKIKIISGGFSRRFIFIYELGDDQRCIPEQYLPDNHKELRTYMVSHLKKVAEGAKQYQWDPSSGAKETFYSWYRENWQKIREADPMMAGFLSTKDEALLRLMILFDLDKPQPLYLLTEESFVLAKGFFDHIEHNLSKLFIATGRNELAVPIERVIDNLRAKGGLYPAKRFISEVLDKEFNPIEQTMILRHLRDNDRIVQEVVTFPGGAKKEMFMLREFYVENVKSGQIQERKQE